MALPIMISSKDIAEVLGISRATASKKIKLVNQKLIDEGYSIISAWRVPLRKFCDYHCLDYDTVAKSIQEYREDKFKKLMNK